MEAQNLLATIQSDLIQQQDVENLTTAVSRLLANRAKNTAPNNSKPYKNTIPTDDHH